MLAKDAFVADPEYDNLLKYMQKVSDNLKEQYVVQGGFDDVAKIWQSWGRLQGALEMLRALQNYRLPAKP